MSREHTIWATVAALLVLGYIGACDDDPAGPSRPPQVATPQFFPAPDSFEVAQQVIIHCATDEAEIRYTIDGRTPDLGSPLYESPVDVDASMVLSARAWRSGWRASELGSGRYTIVSSEETISEPSEIVGPSEGSVDTPYEYSSGSAESDLGHPVEYRFDWDDESVSAWGNSSATHSWSQPGSFDVRVRARCAIHTTVDSAQIIAKTVIIEPIELVGAPHEPSGAVEVLVGAEHLYSTDGGQSNLGHAIEYQLDWNDGSLSSWGSHERPHIWSVPGTYLIRARARCATHTNFVSMASTGLLITVRESSTELVSAPETPTGTSIGELNTAYSYSATGAVSDHGHAVEYRFDWGDGGFTDWSQSDRQHSWSAPGVYAVRAQARCVDHPEAVSGWSPALWVSIPPLEIVNRPDIPTGPSEGHPGSSYEYSTAGAFSSLEHSVEYQFDWGDGSTSSWGASTLSHVWAEWDYYDIRARARCTVHTEVVSAWSTPLNVLMIPAEVISVSPAPSGPTDCVVDQAYTYTTTGATSNLGHFVEHQFDWGDGTLSSWAPTGLRSHAWSSRGNYSVRVRARCIDHPEIVAEWSPDLRVMVSP